MSKDVQQSGSTRDIEDLRVGEERQVTVDMSDWGLRVHDGATPGGHKIPNRDSNDSRYQVKNPELDGFAFPDEAKGYMARIGPGTYVLRTLKVTTTGLTIAYGNGETDDPLIALADTISSNHVFSGTIEFHGPRVPFTNGITADVDGNVTGDVTGNLTGNATGDHQGSLTGAVDVRGDELLLDDNQIEMGKINGLAAALSATQLHSGFIMLWSGAVADIPAGWYLCDGSNGTPDLRDSFVRGAGGALDPGDTGGTSSHGHTITITADGVHSHTATGGDFTLTTSEMPSHYHGSGVCDTSALAFNHGTIAAVPAVQDIQTNGGTSGVVEAKTTNTGGGNPHSHSVTVDNSASHTHAAASNSVSHIPPFYALCYVMKG